MAGPAGRSDRRAGFAATWSEIQRDLSDGPEVAIERVLRPQTGAGDVGATSFEDLSRVIGDAPAHTLGNIGRSMAQALRTFVSKLPGQGKADA